jgi:hypothetical protein
MVAGVIAGADGAGLIAPAAARLAEDGGAAGWIPAGVMAWGVAWAEGSAGAAERATADESGAAVSFFHHAQRGPDWHPILATSTAEIVNE